MIDLSKNKTYLKKYSFDASGCEELRTDPRGIDWPVVYILKGNKKGKDIAYVGETSSAHRRMTQHLKKNTSKFLDEYVLVNDLFNKSAILDIENMLIDHMHADGKFQLENLNNGQSKFHNYYQRGVYKELFRKIWSQLKTNNLVNKNINEVENSDLFKYSPFKQLTNEQYELQLKLLFDISTATPTNKKTIIVEGGAGTGKSVLAISLIKYLTEIMFTKRDYSDMDSFDIEDDEETLLLNKQLSAIKNRTIAFIAPLTEFRNTIRSVFKTIPLLHHVKVLSPSELTKVKGGFDIVIVDEAHRLATYNKSTSHKGFQMAVERLNQTDYQSFNQLKWIEKQSNMVTILFYDRRQSTSGADVPESEFNELTNRSGSISYSINHQIRLLAGVDYINYWNDLLTNKTTLGSPNFSKTGYDFKIYDDCQAMLTDIKEKDKECHGLCRVLSGYGFKFTKTMRDKKGTSSEEKYDFIIDGIPYHWNGINSNYMDDENSSNLIGSVFSTQGYDLNYAGIIFSHDIKYNTVTKKIEAVPELYYDTHGKVGNDINKTIEDIINSYLVLLTRGIKGTYIYACDLNLRNYLKEKFRNN